MYQNGKKLYRSKDRVFLGVCKGIAEWRDLPVFWVRVFSLLAFFSTGFFPVGFLYFIAALILPVGPSDEEYRREHRYYSQYKSTRFDRERDWDNRFTKKKRESK